MTIAVVSAVTGLMAARRTNLERARASQVYGAALLQLTEEGWRFSQEDVYARAGKLWYKMFPPKVGEVVHPLSNRARFVKLWHQRCESGEWMRDKAGRGRKFKLDSHGCEAAITLIRAGFLSTGEPYPHLKAACRDRSELNDMRVQCGYSFLTFLRRLRRHDPQLKRWKARVTRQFTEEQKTERVKVCRVLLDMYNRHFNYFKRIFWLDCKTLYCVPKAGYVLCHKEDRDRACTVDARLNDSDKVLKLKFYAMANWYNGIVAVWFTQGTSDSPLKYKVRLGRLDGGWGGAGGCIAWPGHRRCTQACAHGHSQQRQPLVHVSHV